MIRAPAVKQNWHMLLEPPAINECEIIKSHRANGSRGARAEIE